MDWILIESLEIDTIIGIHAHEQVAPQPLRISLWLGSDNRLAAASERIGDTLDYAVIASRLRDLAKGRRWLLIETLAERSAELLRDEFGVRMLRLQIDKPSAVPEARSVGVQIERHYPDGVARA